MKRRCFSLVAAVLVFLVAARAHAADTSEHAYEKWAISSDLLGYLGGRVGAQVEHRVASRDSVALYAFYLSSESDGGETLSFADDSYQTRTRAFGGDFQFRHWFGPGHGLSGFFVAPGLELQHFATKTTGSCMSEDDYTDGNALCTNGPSAQSFTMAGASLDVGGQIVFWRGFVFGGSVGAHVRGVIAGNEGGPHAWSWDVSNGQGFRPRARLWLGWAF